MSVTLMMAWLVTPTGMCPGQRAMNGTRNPPSCTEMLAIAQRSVGEEALALSLTFRRGEKAFSRDNHTAVVAGENNQLS